MPDSLLAPVHLVSIGLRFRRPPRRSTGATAMIDGMSLRRGYRSLFVWLMSSARDEGATGAEDRWVSGYIGLIYVAETVVIVSILGKAQGLSLAEIEAFGMIASVVAVAIVFVANRMLYMRQEGWRGLLEQFETADHEARRTSKTAAWTFIVVSATAYALVLGLVVHLYADFTGS